MIDKKRSSSFQIFFGDDQYLHLKNHLYNYRLRKRAVQKCFTGEHPGMILEVGSGISPVMTSAKRMVYSDISPQAVGILKKNLPHGRLVVADCMHLPFRPGVFTHVIASEVIEHLEDDYGALHEMARVLRNQGRIVLTFPHKKAYFAVDDRLVGHFRRYEIREMEDMLNDSFCRIILRGKVLGVLEKCIMIPAAVMYLFLKRRGAGKGDEAGKAYSHLLRLPLLRIFRWMNTLIMGVAWMDARVMPFFMASVVIIMAEKIAE